MSLEIELKDIVPVLLNFTLGRPESECFSAQLNGSDPASTIQLLRERNSRLYSYASIADLLGMSKAHVHRLAKQENNEDA